MRLAGEELTMVPMHELSEIENETDSQLWHLFCLWYVLL
jgi:hypothetical protein